jgi:hypothetical protein
MLFSGFVDDEHVDVVETVMDPARQAFQHFVDDSFEFVDIHALLSRTASIGPV